MAKSTVPPPASAVTFGTTTVATDDRREDDELRALRAEVARFRAMEAELMQLLGTKRADRLVHDIRNLLQERIFLLAACREPDEK